LQHEHFPRISISQQIISFLIFQAAVVYFVCSWPGSDLGSIKRSILCKMRWRGTTWYNVTVMHISTVIGGKARYHIRRWPYVVWVSAVCTVYVRIWTLTNAHGLFVLSNCYTLAGFIFPGGSDRINWEFIMWAYEGRVYPLILNVEIYIRSARYMAFSSCSCVGFPSLPFPVYLYWWLYKN